MREVVGNIWDYHAKGHWVGITTNAVTKENGEAVMGRGIALQAAQRFPLLARQLGAKLRHDGNHVYAWPDYRLFTFPTKRHWQNPSPLALIEQSAVELTALIDQGTIQAPIVIPRPGCGNGQLDWKDVGPVLAKIWNDRFLVITQS
jgi:hypothetical protein